MGYLEIDQVEGYDYRPMNSTKESSKVSKNLSRTVSDKKERILQAAVEVFSRKGYHQTKMEEVAAAAGIGKGTIYEYFESKLSLFQEMLASSMQFYRKRLQGESSDLEKLPFRDRLYFLVSGHLRFCQENQKIARVVFWDNPIFGDEEFKKWAEQLRKSKERTLQALVEKAITAGEIRQVDTKIASHFIIGTLGSFWAPIVLDGWDIDPEEGSSQLVDMIMHGLGKS